MKFISFNINGLRSRFHQLNALIEKHDPDVIGLQETKVHDEQFPTDQLACLGYHVVYHGQKSHYGVAFLTKKAPLAVQKGFTEDDMDAQRRLISIDLPLKAGKITVINGYFPQGENEAHPIKYPMKRRFYHNLLQHLTLLEREKQYILVMGDMNIAPTDRDIGISADNQKRWLRTGKTCFLPEERQWIREVFDLGYFDTFREANPNVNDHFSWFDYRSYGFDTNSGLRIDLILANHKLAPLCIGTGIDYEIRAMEKPSDHAPTWAEFSLS